MKKFFHHHPDLTSFLCAAFAMLVCFMLGRIGSLAAQDTTLMRCAFVGAAALLNADMLATTTLALKRETTHITAHRWMHGFYMGFFFASTCLMMTWSGPDFAPILLAIWACSGAVYGGFMTWQTVSNLNNPAYAETYAALDARFAKDSAYLSGPKWRKVYFATPIVLSVYFATIGAFGLAKHNTALFFLQIVCFGSAYQPYARFGVKNFLDVIKKDPTKIAGLSLSFIGFLAY